MDEILKALFKVSKKVLVNMLNSLFVKEIDPETTEIEISNSEFVTEELGLSGGLQNGKNTL